MRKTYTFYPGTYYSTATVEICNGFDTCVVDVPTFLQGRLVFPCGSGNDYKLSHADINEIKNTLRSDGVF